MPTSTTLKVISFHLLSMMLTTAKPESREVQGTLVSLPIVTAAGAALHTATITAAGAARHAPADAAGNAQHNATLVTLTTLPGCHTAAAAAGDSDHMFEAERPPHPYR